MMSHIEPLYINRLSQPFPGLGWGWGGTGWPFVSEVRLRNLGPHGAHFPIKMFHRAPLLPTTQSRSQELLPGNDVVIEIHVPVNISSNAMGPKTSCPRRRAAIKALRCGSTSQAPVQPSPGAALHCPSHEGGQGTHRPKSHEWSRAETMTRTGLALALWHGR